MTFKRLVHIMCVIFLTVAIIAIPAGIFDTKVLLVGLWGFLLSLVTMVIMQLMWGEITSFISYCFPEEQGLRRDRSTTRRERQGVGEGINFPKFSWSKDGFLGFVSENILFLSLAVVVISIFVSLLQRNWVSFGVSILFLVVIIVTATNNWGNIGKFTKEEIVPNTEKGAKYITKKVLSAVIFLIRLCGSCLFFDRGQEIAFLSWGALMLLFGFYTGSQLALWGGYIALIVFFFLLMSGPARKTGKT